MTVLLTFVFAYLVWVSFRIAKTLLKAEGIRAKMTARRFEPAHYSFAEAAE